MHSHFLTFFQGYLVGGVEGDFLLLLGTHPNEIVHLFGGDGQVTGAVIAFPGDKLQVVADVSFEVDNLFLGSEDKDKTMDDRFCTDDFPPVTRAENLVLGDEIFQTVLTRQQFFCFLLILVCPHYVPLLFFC